MKQIAYLLFLLFLPLSSCSDHDESLQDLSLDASYVYLQPGGQKTVAITGGNGGYKLSGGFSDVVGVELQDNLIIITGIAYGSAVVSLNDGAGRSAEVVVRVTHEDEESGSYFHWEETIALEQSNGWAFTRFTDSISITNSAEKGQYVLSWNGDISTGYKLDALIRIVRLGELVRTVYPTSLYVSDDDPERTVVLFADGDSAGEVVLAK